MSREERDFYKRPEDEQQEFLTNTWCNECMEANLGMKDPQEYVQDKAVFIEGKCNRCGMSIVTELTDENF
ncbi:hypothetical protein [Motiliproteus sp. MSK22-1]|uniref:hypothetical protein n=1 Tax=Motiliproteus sp. MSK22-1 TaxID=1897630 RepID=UPI0009762FB8|nr:hypothetical protein [Motiliproteus sp. MSK22-1]OMH25886.1 hypothetical protein BGP75_25580 [Motiliproteus sp. MSK22-1]